MGHQGKVVAQQSGWDPHTFLGKVFASLAMRFASEHDVLGGCLSRVRPATCPATGRDHLYREMATLWPHRKHVCT